MFFNVEKNREKLITMFEMQAVLNANSGIENAVIDDIKLAISMECAEAIDHIEWKWWKKRKDYNDDIAIKRVQMELVDVWHFVMSLKIESSLKYSGFYYDGLIDDFTEFDNDYVRPEALSTIDKIYRLMTNPNSLSYFCDACISCGLDFDDLYLLYLAKNTLNKFRQDNAYRSKDGVEYVKMWGDGLEDNDYLFELAEGMKRCISLPHPDEIKTLFYDALQAKYDDVLLSIRNISEKQKYQAGLWASDTK